MKRNPIWKHRLLILRRLLAGAFYRMLGRLNAALQPQELFSIKPGYHHAAYAEEFDDTGNNADEWQRSVYQLAATLATKENNPSIIDIGCGAAYKLINMLGHYNTLGIEVEPAYSWLQQKYPTRDWSLFSSVASGTLKADIVICSDVIEHIENPDTMMDFLAGIDFRILVLSTPERDNVRGKSDYGPPQNTAHYREWNTREFKEYAGSWFKIDQHMVFDDKSITQVVVCSKR